MVIRTPVALHIAFRVVSSNSYPNSLMGVFSMVRQAFLDAQHYQAHWAAYRANPRGLKRPTDDPSLEALLPALKRELPVVFHADTEREIIRALDFAREFNLRPIIAGGREAEKVVDRLKAAQAAVLLSLNFPPSAPRTFPQKPTQSRFRYCGRAWQRSKRPPSCIAQVFRLPFRPADCLHPKPCQTSKKRLKTACLPKLPFVH
jgi:hypothetical protein